MRHFIICTILSFCLFAIGCKGLAYRSSNESMKPTINLDDMCVANPLEYVVDNIQRFDIVVFQAPEDVKERYNLNNDTRYIKRVIGLPNEKIEIKNNEIFIDDKLLVEKFEKITDENDFKKDFPPMVIPNNEYYLLGDNRPQSEDSRYWKKPTISKKNIYSEIVEIKKDFYKDK
ncbi:MAG: signal peptidase I [Aridibacter sp.]